MRTAVRLTMLVMTVGGGFTGFVMTAQLLSANFSSLRAADRAIAISFATQYSLVVCAGLLYAHDPRRLVPLAVAFALQVPFVSSPLLSYRFTAGAHATVGIVGLNLVAAARLGCDFQFTLAPPQPWGLGVNLLAVLFLALIVWLRRAAPEPVPPAAWQGAGE